MVTGVQTLCSSDLDILKIIKDKPGAANVDLKPLHDIAELAMREDPLERPDPAAITTKLLNAIQTRYCLV